MQGAKQRLFGLCAPPLLLCLLDCTLTLVGQSAQYWTGDYASVNEVSPTFHQFLQVHPAAFVAGIAIWSMVFVGCILLLPDTLALIASIAITFGHTAGAATWLLYRFHYGYQACNGLVLLSAMLLAIGIRWGWRAAPEQEYRLWRLPSFARWALVALLSGVGVYLYLWPRTTSDSSVSRNEEDSTGTVGATVSTDRELEQLKHVPELTQLCLSGREITDAGMVHLDGLTRLQSLTLRDVQFTGAGLEHLQRLSELKFLDLESVDVPGDGLRHLAELTQIQALVLHGPQVTDAWLERVKGLTQLQAMSLAGTKVTDAGLEHLEPLKLLRTLNLVGTLVTDDGLRRLQRLSQLRWLYLSETKITDAGLEHLHGLTGLEALYLGFTNSTSEGRMRFRQALPKCTIVR